MSTTFRYFLAALLPACATTLAAAPSDPTPQPPPDVVKFTNGLSPEAAAKEMTLPPGFKATLFAGEPDIVQPIAFCIDDRGRLWVAENHSYPKWQTDGKPGKDRILIFEDKDGDGHFDTCKVFHDK